MTAPNPDWNAEGTVAWRQLTAERDALQARVDEQTERADMWDNEAHQGYEINGDLQARVEELEAALRPLARTRYCTNAESDDARAVLRSDRKEDQ